jgi:S-(hydroxymethyl)glutathione dehydrogenase/alcohol dehydrogenase
VQAALLRAPKERVELVDLELPAPPPGFVQVRVAASGICRSDLSVIHGTMPQPMPCVLGHEGAGIVEALGDDVDDATGVAVGAHVVLSWMAACRQCFHCLRGHPELCDHGIDHAFGAPYATVGSGEAVHAGFGTATFGGVTNVPAACVVPIDDDFPLDLAALVGCGVVTGTGAVLRSARVPVGASVAVIGCGGVGLAAIQAARLSGAQPIVAVDRIASKLPLAQACGATHVVDASDHDAVAFVRDVTGGRGADFAFEVVGRSDTIRAAYASARRGGVVTVVGAGGFDDPVTFSAMELMVDAKTIRGTVYGDTDPARDVPEAIRLHRAGALDLTALVTERIGLADLPAALDALEAGDGARRVIVYA